MPNYKESVSRRLNELIELANSQNFGPTVGGEVTSGTISILEKLYGPHSDKIKAYSQLLQRFTKYPEDPHSVRSICLTTVGVLKSIKSEIEAGLVGNLEQQAQGGIFGDFITLAKESLDESKDVAAVLVSAALEDALKKFAVQNGLDVDEKDMTEVINALKREGLIKGTQASIVQGYTKFRNKAFHADWEKIDKTSVRSAIGFTEGFILEHFS